MKSAIIWIFIAFFLAVVWLAVRGHQGRALVTNSQKADPKIYLGLRDIMLHGSRAKFGIAPGAKSTEPYGVLMDWGIPAGTATVVAVADGTASVYLSSGGGFLGGGQSHESIRNAAKNAVSIAGELQPMMQATTTYPLPLPGQVVFYVLTDDGVFTASASDEDLRSHRSPLFKLGDAEQAIITEYRRIQ